ncbi:MAG: 4Fe-4S dicluster domain-containing protein [Acidobacteria bacterium]|nr:4Fe-4S dicluster domain-containing protein [Acidobacteriota bacterium]
MSIDRRALLKLGLLSTTAAAARGAAASEAAGDVAADASGDATSDAAQASSMAVLVDTTLCIGCRKCEDACNRRNRLPRGAEPFWDRNVMRTFRRPGVGAFTVVNRFPGNPSPDQTHVPDTYAKSQCMHCLYPSCVSACIVGAMKRRPDGAVVYNSTICLGCRYCQVACPFEVPAYEFNVALAPKVKKCEFCTSAPDGTGPNPACAASCPTEALVFGRRADLLVMAHDRLKRRPDRYRNHVYGETEVGGTSWLYLTGRPVTQIGLLDLPEAPPPQLTEAIQHGIFRWGALPIAFYGVLAALMWRNRPAPPPPPPPPADTDGDHPHPVAGEPETEPAGRER